MSQERKPSRTEAVLLKQEAILQARQAEMRANLDKNAQIREAAHKDALCFAIGGR